MTDNRTHRIKKLHELVARLIEHADSIVNVAAHEMEKDLRLAAKIIDHAAGLAPSLGDLIE